MIKKAAYVGILGIIVAVVGVVTLHSRLPVGPVILSLAIIPLAGIVIAKRAILSAIPDLIFGAIDTGLLTIPALWGGAIFGRTPPIDSEMIQRVVVGGETPEEAWEWAYTEMQKAADEWKAANPDWTPAGQ